MAIADYNHDGRASEFVVLTNSLPCGHTYGTLIGVSPNEPKLHAFGSIAHPDSPLVLPTQAWTKLRTSKGPFRVVDWQCGDHGSQQENDFEVEATPGGFKVTRYSYSCPEGGTHGKLTEEEDF
jgi:hypothetical protein